MTKAVASYTKGWARDLGPKGISANTVQSPTDTDINPSDSDLAAMQKAGTVVGRTSGRKKLLRRSRFLRAEASYITGTTLDADGAFNA